MNSLQTPLFVHNVLNLSNEVVAYFAEQQKEK